MTRRSWLRTAYWVGAIADALNGIGMVFPRLLSPLLRLDAAPSSIEVRSALGMGAALMFGWTALLLWANQRPVERKGVLALTVFPVIFGLALTVLYANLNGYIPFAGAVSIWIFQACLAAVFLTAYFFAPDEQRP
jgi:amino acid permease